MKIQSVRKITEFPYLNLFEIRYEDRETRDRLWRFASRKAVPVCAPNAAEAPHAPDAVVIVPFHVRQNRLVIIREFRVTLGDYQYGFPAGLMEPGEGLEACAERELREETGLAVTRWIKTGPPVYSSSGLTDESIVLAYVECDGEPSRSGNTASEDIEPLLVSPEEASALCGDERLKFDVKTWLVLSMYGDAGRIG